MIDSNWRPNGNYPEISKAPIVAIDLETKDPELESRGPGSIRGDGFVCGISIAVPGFRAYYPIGHLGGDNLPKDTVLRWLAHELAAPNPKVGANIGYDLEWLHSVGVRNIGGRKHDVQIREALIDENERAYDLSAIAVRHGLPPKDEVLLYQYAASQGHTREKEVKANIHKYPARYVGPYAEQDASLPLEIYERQQAALDRDGLSVVADLEARLTDVLLAMRLKGIPVDINRAERVLAEMDLKKREAAAELKVIVGNEVDVWSSQSIATSFEKFGYQYPRTPKGAPSFTAEWLAICPYPLAQKILRIRKLDRAGSVFIRKKIIDSSVRGRIHPLYAQTRTEEFGTKSGRLSSRQPNMQQIPARSELAPLIRSIFTSDTGRFGVWDYSQQEPRVTVHYAYLRGFRGAAEARQRYIDDPSTDYHQLVADMANLTRGVAKPLNLGLAYGMGGAKLCRQLGLPVDYYEKTQNGRTIRIEVAGEEGKRIMNQYHAAVPFVKLLGEDCSRIARQRGYIKTILGRRSHFPDGFGYHKAMNRAVQGSSADMIKLGMVMLYEEEKYLPYNNVHDEIDGPVESDVQANRVTDVLLDVGVRMGLTVPMKVDNKIGPSWGEATKI